MKKIVLIFSLILFFNGCKKEDNALKIDLGDSWKQLNIESKIDFTTIFFIDEENGFIGGVPVIDSIFFSNHLNISNLFLSGLPPIETDSCDYFSYKVTRTVPINLSPSFFKTNDGGKTWKIIKTPFLPIITDIFFLDKSYGFVATKYDGVFKTTDGGDHWEKVLANFIVPAMFTTVVNSFKQIRFFNQLEGFVYADDGYRRILIKTMDGGSSWAFVSNNFDNSLPLYSMENSMILKDKKTGLFFNRFGKLFKTTNKGVSWELIGESLGISDIYFENEEVGYYVNYRGIYKTQNGGKDWELERPVNDLPFSNIIGNIHGKLFVFESGEAITANLLEGIVYLSEDPNYGFRKILNVGAGQLNNVCFPSEKVGYGLGNHGRIFKYTKK